MKALLAFVILLLGAPAAFSQTVSSCPTATPGTVWNKNTFLPCSTAVDYLAEPVSKSAIVSDLRCSASGCLGSWQLGSNVRSTDQVWVKNTAYPSGTWVAASKLKFSVVPPCTKLVYVGAPLTMVTTTGPNQATVTSPVFGTVTLINPLPANGTTTFAPSQGGFIPTPGLVAWDFSSQDPILSSAVSGNTNPYTQPTFSFTTIGGVIVAWNFTVYYFEHFYVGGFTETITSSSASGDTVSFVEPLPILPPNIGYSITGSNNTPGTWTCQITYSSNFP